MLFYASGNIYNILLFSCLLREKKTYKNKINKMRHGQNNLAREMKQKHGAFQAHEKETAISAWGDGNNFIGGEC